MGDIDLIYPPEAKGRSKTRSRGHQSVSKPRSGVKVGSKPTTPLPHSVPSVSSNKVTNKAKKQKKGRGLSKGGVVDPTQPRHHDTVTPSTIESIRKAVKQVGKEAATHRFTTEEKNKIADIVYTYFRQGYRTSENEISRIATNWLIKDYERNGKESVLHRVLKALKE